MFSLDRWKEIWASISSNKLRTILSGFTIALALFVFIVLFGLSKGLENGFQEEFFPAESKTIRVSASRTTMPYKGHKAKRSVELKYKDYQFLENEFKADTDFIIPVTNNSSTVKFGTESGSYTIVGTNYNQQYYKENTVVKGRFLTPQDAKNKTKNIVIGRLVEKDLFKNENPIGKKLQIGSILYHIVGVFSDEDGDDEERLIYIPIETLQLVYSTDILGNIQIMPNSESSLDKIKNLSERIETALKQQKEIHPNDNRGIRIFDSTEGLETTAMFSSVFKIVVFIIGAGSLIAGIMGIGNIMLYSVKERTKEIGIRKALGASPKSIIGLILQEAMLITFLSGFVGILTASFFIENIENNLTKYLIYNPKVEKSTIVLATVILFFSGLIAGYLPARRAAKIKPIIALRNK